MINFLFPQHEGIVIGTKITCHLISKRNYFHNSYFVKMFREWNKLPIEIKNVENYEH